MLSPVQVLITRWALVCHSYKPSLVSRQAYRALSELGAQNGPCWGVISRVPKTAEILMLPKRSGKGIANR